MRIDERPSDTGTRGENRLRVIVLGATGMMGRRAAEEFGRSPEVTRLTLAGRDLRKVQALAHEIGGAARAVQVDARDHHALVEAIKGHDVAAGSIGPFYLFEAPMAKAAIEAGVHYVSICDDHDATLEAFKLDGAAKERGITVLTGAGWTPGLTNIMAKKGAGMLDEAREVHVSWAGTYADSDGYAVQLHILHILTGLVPTFKDGRLTKVRAGTEPKTVRFPEPIGPVQVRHTGHPEPLTIPRYIPGLEHVTLSGGLTEGVLNRLSLLLTRLGLTRTPKGRERLLRLVTPTLPLIAGIGRPAKPLSGTHVEVRGHKDGKPARVVLTAVDRMMNLTALPQVVTALMLGRGELRHPGVIALEAPGGPDPDRFLTSLAELGVSVEIDLENP